MYVNITGSPIIFLISANSLFETLSINVISIQTHHQLQIRTCFQLSAKLTVIASTNLQISPLKRSDIPDVQMLAHIPL